MSPPKRLVIFCDGTWVGRETAVPNAPPSNIRKLANMVGTVQFAQPEGREPTIVHPILTYDPNVIAGYQEGVGLNKTFLSYIWDGATASSIGEECISVYKFIVQNFTSEHDEIWLFGFSRGSFTVRCVGGMINNCGIIRRGRLSGEDVNTLCREVYRTYRSPLAVDHPKSRRCEELRGDPERVWPVHRPIRFMGLIDTVGALGIPRLNAGIGLDWPEFEFHDQNVSSAVKTVYHAPALHDRLWCFQPCLIFPGDGECRAEVVQKWFPGCHYDLGRQTFRFLRQRPWNPVERWLGLLPDKLGKTIWPNEVLGNCVLRWLLEAVRDIDKLENDLQSPIIPNIESHIDDLNARLVSPNSATLGSGDVYGDILSYGPLGRLYKPIKRLLKLPFLLLDHVFPRLGDNVSDLLGVKTVVGILTATTDRRVPGAVEAQAQVYPYKNEEAVAVSGVQRRICVEEGAGMRGGERYKSRAYENWELWRGVFGV
ncbi:hypothetical protein BU26DRAFT_157517 [Trematosphaeria pertusa]|uniref:T6SS Phospholipase effector Tle1-like catalytic domain-containing protein n=1 Tax=Trematosphaeria pertusa TaxID=390896 RepID=A0A6A6HW32_9PLEO|nr:uncharacterized protein BU26DRAFT_157517 [Trematosphaeria pertusa]KAF2242251.1 hypothetical protein BU26DRAFT_157517 [Trematosphaeria pertusa]